MADIKWTIEESRIEWTLPASGKDPAEQIFEEEYALAHLLLNNVVFLNSHWHQDHWLPAEQKYISVNVNCNDCFAWGCADAEPLPHDQIETLYRMWRKDPAWGADVWCMIQRNQMPQKPVEDRIRKAGIWDLDSLGLRPNVINPNGHEDYKAEQTRLTAEYGREVRPPYPWERKAV